MSEGPGDRGSSDDADSLLRALASMPEQMPEYTPERLAHFRVTGVLGRGGMGIVYRAHDESLRRDVAVKLLPATNDTERRQRFLREARSAARITHPNVAVVHQIGEDSGRVYIAMELVSGESLRQRLERGRLDPHEALAIAKQIARGLSAAHDQGIVHRDLKPENVMITGEGVVKLLDFGLAKPGTAPASSDSMDVLADTEALVTSDERRILGTPGYMSPEQAVGEPVDVRSDVFSVGVVLYEMLAGTRPFQGATVEAIRIAIARDPAPSLRAHTPAVGADVDALVSRCLAKAPADRFANAGEILVALGGQRSPGVSTQSRLHAAPIVRGSAERSARRALRTATLALAVTAALAGGAWWLARPRRPAPPLSAASASAGGASLVAGMSRSPDGMAQSFFEQALRSFRDGTGQERTLLERAIERDKTFAGAYLRLEMLPEVQNRDPAASSYHRQLVTLQSALSPRDRELFDAIEDPDPKHTNSRLDSYLARYPDDDLAWVARLDGDEETLNRALAARPDLPALLAAEAAGDRFRAFVAAAGHSPDVTTIMPEKDQGAIDALAVLDRCLQSHPVAVDCLSERAAEESGDGACDAAERDVRRWLDLKPDARTARPMLAGLIASHGAPLDIVREVLGDPARAVLTLTYITPDVVVPMFVGDFPEVERLGSEIATHVPPIAAQYDHFVPMVAAMLAYSEQGDLRAAARIGSDYLSRSAAWPTRCDSCQAAMVAAAARGGRLDRRTAAEQIEAAFQSKVAAGAPPGQAWAEVYAYAAQTPDEARAAVAKLDELHTSPSPDFGPSSARTFFFAGRGDQTRRLGANVLRACTTEFDNTMNWVHVHLYFGELDEQSGDTASACAHYAKVLARWGNAKPRSVTADEARAHSSRLGCP